jgi:hypothetical protein
MNIGAQLPRQCLCLVAAAGLATAVMAQEVASDAAALNAKASKLDPANYEFVQPVCTRCHDTSMILHSRSWSQWQDVLAQMKRYGAKGTQEQWDHIFTYVGHNLTLIDVNHADEDELSAVLGVDEKTAIAMVQRRYDRRFKNVEDVESVPGVDKNLIEAMEPRLLFGDPSVVALQ